MTTIQAVELGVLGPLQARQDGAPVTIPGAKPRAILTMLGLHGGSVVSAETLIDLLWGDDPPRTAAKALQTHISSLRRALGDGFVLTEGTGWILSTTKIDAPRYKLATRMGRDAAAAGDTTQAVVCFEEALTLWRGTPELPDSRRGISEKTRWVESHAALVEDRADALLATGRAAEVVGELEAAVADAPLRERRWGQLMLALYRAGRQGEALGAYQRARSLLADELGVDPGPELRRLDAAIVAQDAALDYPVTQHLPSVTRAVTFLLTDIEGSTAAWESEATAMAVALARHDELAEQVVTSRGGRLIKTRGEGDATFSVFERPSAAAAAAIELQDAIHHEPWALREPLLIRVALHTGEVELRDGDYFGRAVNRAARLRSLAVGGQILCSGATAELVIDSLSDDVALADLGMRQLRNLPRPEHVFELRQTSERPAETSDEPLERPGLPAVLTGPGPFVGRVRELERLASAWQNGGTHAVLIAGEPGVGKTRLADEWSRHAYGQGAIVLYGRSDEDLGAPYQPFAESLRSLVPCIGAGRLRGLRGIEALLPLVPGLTEVLPDLCAPPRADPDTERYALFDAVVALLELASASAPVVLILDDLHWAAKPTLLLLRHLLRFGDHARVQVVATYRSTDLDRSHPLAAMLADLHRDGTADRLALGGLDADEVTAYVAEAGYDDEELANALASVTGGNPFFLIEALRHVDESGGVWDPSTLPQGVREAVSRRLSRLPAETNKALAAAAVVGSRFALDLVERVVDQDLVDAFDEACKAGIVIEEPGGYYRFNHAIVRQSLLAELASVRRMRLHQRIATTLEGEPGADDELLAELAHHYFECAWAGNAAKAVGYCRRAADQAMSRLAYEGAADLYDHALHALDEIDQELPDRADQAAELLVARCEALLAAGDVASAAGAVAQLHAATVDSARLAAWATCFDGQLSMLIHPERLDEAEAALGAAADKLAGLDDAAGEAKAHTVRAGCLARLGRIGDCEIALDNALGAARRAGEHRRVNAVLAGAPLAALWGPNPVPRAGGRCLDVVRLLRITTDSPAVEATSTRCQAVLEAFRGRAAAARRMIDSARRTVTELGLRHALLEVEQFAGIVELVVDDPAAAEPYLRRAYRGFRSMRLDADTAETAALLGRACLALDRDAEADELCSESERLAGHALKSSIAWRTLRALLLTRRGEHDEARRMAQAAVGLAEQTDGLVDHGDACLALATVLGAAGDVAGARAAAERAVDLYERKGAAALADKAHRILGERDLQPVPAPPELPPTIELDTACVRAGEHVIAVINHEAWDEVEPLFAPDGTFESRRKIVGFGPIDVPAGESPHVIRRILESVPMRVSQVVLAIRGERVALARLTIGTADVGPGSPLDEFLILYGIDKADRVTLQVWFDLEDMDAALAELDAAQAQFDEQRPQPRRPKNAASRLYEQIKACFSARDWHAMTELLAENVWSEDRRRVVNSGVRQGRDAMVVELVGMAEAGIDWASEVVATRGARLVVNRIRGWDHAQGPDGFLLVLLDMIEIDADGRFVTRILFDSDDVDAAIAELDARYLAGEGALYAGTWSVILQAFAAFNEHELPSSTPDWVNFDHRRGRAFSPGDLIPYIHAAWDLTPQARIYIEAVHRVSNVGAVVTQALHGTSPDGFDAEWLEVNLLMVEGDLINRSELFDEADLDVALARFDQLSRPASRLENAASRADDQFIALFAGGCWDVIETLLADDIWVEDRRKGFRRLSNDRVTEVKNIRAIAMLGAVGITVMPLAVRGDRLCLSRLRFHGGDDQPEATSSGETIVEALSITEVDTNGLTVARTYFDPDDIDAAFAELDARYLAGEAAQYARTWSAVARGLTALNLRELPATTNEWINIDHRRIVAFAPGEMIESLRAARELATESAYYIEAVHRLDNLGAVVTHTAYGTSQEGFDAEWRLITVLTVEGDLVDNCEIFDEDNLDTALARFDELHPQAPRLENAASQAAERLRSFFVSRDWDAITQILADDVSTDDRRRAVNAGLRHGRDAVIAEISALAEVGVRRITSNVIATRGNRLALSRGRYSGNEDRLEAFRVDSLDIVELDADERIVASVAFDLEDFDAAIAELDARYLAGEAAPYARSWSALTHTYGAANKQQLRLTPDCVNIDHRRIATIETGDLSMYIRTSWDEAQSFRVYIEAVHRLSAHGAVFTQAAHGTSEQGFDAEWREVIVAALEGDFVNRCELFDETDLNAALARFEELQPQPARLGNAAGRVYERILAHFAAEDWAAIAEVLADDCSTMDRRRVVNAGARHGRDAVVAEVAAIADVGVLLTSHIVATRGERLVLSRGWALEDVNRPDAFCNDLLDVVEIDANERVVARVIFDLDDIDAAIAELDARYLAGEAAPFAHTWSVIARGYTALNRREIPATTANFVDIDHRRGTTVARGDLIDYLGVGLGDLMEMSIYVEAVPRLTDLGAVITHVAKGTSPEGLDVEWRMIAVIAVDGGLISRCEIFDEADLDAALARLRELQPQPGKLANEASEAYRLVTEHFSAGNWTAMSETLAQNMVNDDRRHLVNSGIRRGRDVEIANGRAFVELGGEKLTSSVIAIRGERLALCRSSIFGRDQQPGAFRIEFLSVVEIGAGQEMVAHVAFDLDDIDAAIAELDTRYLAGEAAAHAPTWSIVTDAYAGFNRRDLAATTPDWISIDHRRGAGFASGDMIAYIEAAWDDSPDTRIYIAAVHRLSSIGAVVTHVAQGISQDGFDAEWRDISIVTIDGNLVDRSELFDEDDLDTALARFDELS